MELSEFIKNKNSVILSIPLNIAKDDFLKTIRNFIDKDFKKINITDYYHNDNNIHIHDLKDSTSNTYEELYIIQDIKTYNLIQHTLSDTNYYLILSDYTTDSEDLSELKSDLNILYFSPGDMDTNIVVNSIDSNDVSRDIIKEINYKKYKRHYVKLKHDMIQDFEKKFKDTIQDVPLFNEPDEIIHDTKSLVFVSHKNFHPSKLTKNFNFVHIYDCDNLHENIEVIFTLIQKNRSKEYPKSIELFFYTKECNELCTVIENKLKLQKSIKQISKKIFVNRKELYVS